MKDFLSKLFAKGKLKLVEPSKEIMNSHIKKSESNFISSKILYDNDKFEESVALTYYSMYNLVLALFFRVGIKSENHSASSILLKKIFGFDNSSLVLAKKERIDKQYYTGFEVAKKEVEEGIFSAESFNRNLKVFIQELNTQKIRLYRNKFKEVVNEN